MYKVMFKSNREKCLYDYLVSKNLEVVSNLRCLCVTGVRGLCEIDLFLPRLNIGIEINSRLYHDSIHVPNYYHAEKTEDALRNGIRLYHFWDWELDCKIKSDISLILDGKFTFTGNRFSRDKCPVKPDGYRLLLYKPNYFEVTKEVKGGKVYSKYSNLNYIPDENDICGRDIRKYYTSGDWVKE